MFGSFLPFLSREGGWHSCCWASWTLAWHFLDHKSRSQRDSPGKKLHLGGLSDDCPLSLLCYSPKIINGNGNEGLCYFDFKSFLFEPKNFSNKSVRIWVAQERGMPSAFLYYQTKPQFWLFLKNFVLPYSVHAAKRQYHHKSGSSTSNLMQC